MPELCRSCERKDIDFGGCRCQTMALAGDAAATDPACLKSPHRAAVDRRTIADIEAPTPPFHYRGKYRPSPP
jgi:pyrroloquinoline quinone biosynthesis protein E